MASILPQAQLKESGQLPTNGLSLQKRLFDSTVEELKNLYNKLDASLLKMRKCWGSVARHDHEERLRKVCLCAVCMYSGMLFKFQVSLSEALNVRLLRHHLAPTQCLTKQEQREEEEQNEEEADKKARVCACSSLMPRSMCVDYV